MLYGCLLYTSGSAYTLKSSILSSSRWNRSSNAASMYFVRLIPLDLHIFSRVSPTDGGSLNIIVSVSYTHLDVYKRQILDGSYSTTYTVLTVFPCIRLVLSVNRYPSHDCIVCMTYRNVVLSRGRICRLQAQNSSMISAFLSGVIIFEASQCFVSPSGISQYVLIYDTNRSTSAMGWDFLLLPT